MEFFNNLDNLITGILNSLGAFAPLLACLLITVESILPVLPLGLFITVNCYYLGILGFIISYVLTCVGCFISYRLCRGKLKKHFDGMMDKKEHKLLKKMMKLFNDINLSELALLIAIPFTPAFLVNIAAGLSNMSTKKFVFGLIIGKFFMAYFWAYIGTSLIESFKNPYILIKIAVILMVVFIISKLVNKRFRLE